MLCHHALPSGGGCWQDMAPSLTAVLHVTHLTSSGQPNMLRCGAFSPTSVLDPLGQVLFTVPFLAAKDTGVFLEITFSEATLAFVRRGLLFTLSAA